MICYIYIERKKLPLKTDVKVILYTHLLCEKKRIQLTPCYCLLWGYDETGHTRTKIGLFWL